MVESKAVTTKLFVNSILDVKDELDERLEKCHGIVLGQVNNFSEREGLDSLQVFASRSQSHHDDVQLGLLYGILSDPPSAIKYYRMMALVCQDGLGKVVGTANQLIYEKWIKLNDVCRTQLTWLSRELIHNSVARADTVCHYLLRQIAGGDISVRNISLTETMLDTLSENRTWLDKNPNFIPVAVYTFLRIIIDHQPPALHNLRQKEVDFCIGLLREKWAECQVIGRDLVRLLQGVARINEFMELWKDIHFNPTTLSPQFSGVKQLMQMKTSRSYFVSRLTPDMETKLGFLTMQVRFGNQKRYQDWFQRQYLSTPESQSLRCDLIRYICTVIHPTNEILCSDIIPRWAVIGWLLTTCTSNVAASNAKLALFYDWLFYDAERDNIMNIEPCILVMYNSMRPHPAITATLLDFMCRIMHNFCPSLTAFVRHGIYASLNSILEKRVLPSLAPLFNNPKMDKDLYSMLKENFPEFCSTESIKEEAMMREQTTDVITNHLENNSTPAETAAFSDEDDNSSTAPKQDSKPGSTKTQNSTFNIDAILSNLEEAVKELVVQMNSESDKEVQCEVMDKLLQKIVRQDFDQEDATNLAKCLCHILSAYFQGKLVPQEMDDESVEESIGMPLFVIFRNIHQTPDEDPSRQTIMMLLEEMYKIQPKIGYYFLYFLKASSRVQHEAKMSAYKDFCKTMENKLDFYLLADLKLCYEDDEIKLISYLVPDIYSQFSSLAVGNIDMLHLIVSSIDGAQLLDLICEILQGHLVMFAKDSFISVLNASLQWETCEQYFLWQLISAHKIPVNLILPILPKLEFTVHSEAITSITILLKQDCPTAEILRPLLCRECKKNDLFTVSLLRFWAQEYGDKLADLLHTQLTRCNGTPSKKKLSRSNKVKDKDQPSTEQILSHLDHMRLACKDISFLSNESIQQALQNVQTSCSEALKVKFGDLLALVEDVEEAKSTRVLRQVPSRRASQAATKSSVNTARPGKRGPAEDSDTSSETSEDEESVQVSKNKKIKRAVLFDD